MHNGNTSATWQKAAHTTYQRSSPSCSTRATQKSLSLNKKRFESFLEKKSGEWTTSKKMTETERARGLSRETKLEIGKGNQMTALRFRTGNQMTALRFRTENQMTALRFQAGGRANKYRLGLLLLQLSFSRITGKRHTLQTDRSLLYFSSPPLPPPTPLHIW